MKAKRILSVLLTVLMLATVVSSLSVPATVAESAEITLTYTNPALTVDVGTEIDLTKVSVQVDANTTLAAKDITWKNGDSAVTTVTPDKKGVTTLTATAGTTTKNVYVVAKNPDETEFVLYENDFDSATTASLAADGWIEGKNAAGGASPYSVSDGALHLGATSIGQSKLMLPKWLGDFGDYAITMSASQTEVANSARWSAIMFHVKDDGTYKEERHITIRANQTANTLEFSGMHNGAWEYPYVNTEYDLRISYVLNMITGYHDLTLNLFGGSAAFSVDGERAIYVEDISKLKNTKHEETTGLLGLLSDQGVLNVDSIKVTVMEQAPEKLPERDNLIDTSANRPQSNITSYVSDQAYAKDEAAFNAIVNAEKRPVAVLLDVAADVTAAKFETYLTTCYDKKIIPEFRITTDAQLTNLVTALKSTLVPEAVVVTPSAELLKSAREQRPANLRGIYEVTAETMTADERFAAYQTAAGANAQGILLPYALATKENVAVLQQFQLSVWALGTGVTTNTQAAYLLASGANAVISDNYALVSEAETKLFTAENSLTRTSVYTAHRGYSEKYAENSMAAYRAAYREGVDNLETDVHLSKDGVVMVMHDDTIDRTTAGTGYIHDKTFDELRQYTLDGTDEPIPTFEEMLIEFKDKDIKILCELKEDQAELPKKTAELVKKYEMEDQVVYISFHSNQVRLIKQELNTCADLLGGTVAQVTDTAAVLNGYYSLQTSALNCNGTLGPSYGGINAEYIRDAGDRGMTFWTWTYSSSVRSTVNPMFLAGMNGLTTNDAAYFKTVVKTITAPDTIRAATNNTFALNAKAVTYGNGSTSIGASAKIIPLDNDGVVEVNEDGTLTAKKNGEATVMVSYEATMPDGATKYTLYTQPITVKVGDIDTLTVNSTDYTLDGDKLTGVAEKTSAKDFLLAIADAGNAKIYDAKGEEVTDVDVIGNGYTIEYKGKKATIIVRGDINSNGKVDAFDYMLVKRGALKTFKLTDIQTLAADVMVDSKDEINANDYMLIKRHVLKSFNLFA